MYACIYEGDGKRETGGGSTRITGMSCKHHVCGATHWLCIHARANHVMSCIQACILISLYDVVYTCMYFNFVYTCMYFNFARESRACMQSHTHSMSSNAAPSSVRAASSHARSALTTRAADMQYYTRLCAFLHNCIPCDLMQPPRAYARCRRTQQARA